MALQGMLYAYDLPAWMYHAQLPPPDHDFDPTLPGLTWVDLVFPFFLFTMGAAMPLALTRRIARGAQWWDLAAYAIRRGVLLLAFALYVEHIVPWKFQDAEGRVSTGRWLWSLLAFAVLFPALVRLPRGWKARQVWLTRAGGWAAAAVVLATVRFPDDTGFLLKRADIIIVVLAHTVTVGSLLWLVSRDNLPLRLGFMLVVLAIILGAESPGWLSRIWNACMPHGTSLLSAAYLKYLLVVLPGTIVGDLLLAWLRGDATFGPADADRAASAPSWGPTRHLQILGLALGLCLLVCCGLQARWLSETTFLAFVGGAAGFTLFREPRRPLEILLRRLYGWGVLWLVVGLLLEPYQGGIKKDHATISYHFVTSGLAVFALVFFSVIIDGLGRRGWLRLLIDSGQNPMIAYVGIRNLLPPLLGLLAIEQLVGRLELTPWAGFGWACVKTILLAAAVSVFTRLRVFWRT